MFINRRKKTEEDKEKELAKARAKQRMKSMKLLASRPLLPRGEQLNLEKTSS